MRVRVVVEMDDGGRGIRAVNALDSALREHNEKLRRADPSAEIDFEVLGVAADAEEPEWEHGFNWVDHPYGEPHMVALGAGEDITAWAARVETEIGEVRLFRRTAPTSAGEWVPMQQEYATGRMPPDLL